MFKALVVDNIGGTITSGVRELNESHLPAGEVTVAVKYSTVNYKDGLVVTGAGGLVKQYPMFPASTSSARSSPAIIRPTGRAMR